MSSYRPSWSPTGGEASKVDVLQKQGGDKDNPPVPQHTSSRVVMGVRWASSKTVLYRTAAAAVFTWKNASGETRNLKSSNVSVKCGSPNRSVYGAWSAVHRVCRLYNNSAKPHCLIYVLQPICLSVWDLSISWCWLWILKSSGMWHPVLWKTDTGVLEKPATSIFRAHRLV